MILKYETNEVPEGLEAHYSKTDSGSYRLNVEGIVTQAELEEQKSKVKEFRQKNTDLLKENGTLNSFKDVLGTSGNLTPENIESKLEAMANHRAEVLISNMKKTHNDEMTTLKTDLNGKVAKLNGLTLTEQVRKAGPKHGVLDSAYDDVMYRAERDWEFGEDGTLKMKASKLNSEGKTIVTLEDWVAETVKVAPHLAAKSTGTGITNGLRKTNSVSQPQETEGMSGVDQIGAALAKKAQNAPRLN